MKLKVSNAQGADSVEQNDFFEILPVYQLGSDSIAADSSGMLYDDGGIAGNYSNNGDWIFTIAPPCARWVELSFMHFDLEQCCDVFRVYDGPDTAAPVVLFASGSGLPPQVRGSSGQLTVRFSSSPGGDRPGFCATWRSETVPAAPPVAAFAHSPFALPLNSPVSFSDQRSGDPREWFWDFGDGNMDTGLVVSHSYANPGPVTVQLIVDNCTGRDTIQQNLVVQQAPQFSFSPDSLFASLTGCDDTVSRNVTIYNHGQGDLLIRGTELPKDPSQLDSVRNRFNRQYTSLNSLIPSRHDFTGGNFGVDIPDGGMDMFDNGNILSTNLDSPIYYFDNFILPGPAFGLNGQYFTRKVPGLFFLAADLGGIERFNISGGLGADGFGKVDGASLYVNKKGVGYRLLAKRVYDAGDPSVNHLILLEDRLGIAHVFPQNTNLDDHEIQGLEDSRRLYYLMFGGQNGRYMSDSLMLQLADRFLDIISPGPDYLQFSPDSATIRPGDSVTIQVHQISSGLKNGRYETDILVQTNDPAFPDTILPCVLELHGTASVQASADSLDFGLVPVRGTASMDLIIRNSGCDSLIIQSMSIDSSTFVLGTFRNLLMPDQPDTVSIRFSPLQQRLYRGRCTLQTNIGTYYFPLRGRALPAPWAVWQPDSISLVFNECFDSASIPLRLYNRGTAPLQWQPQKYRDTLRILALTYGADLQHEYPNTIQAMRDEGLFFSLVESGTDDPDSLKNLLQGIDLLLLPEAETGFLTVWQSFRSTISQFVSTGGNVLGIASTAGGSGPLFAAGLIDGQYRGATNGQLRVALPEEPLARGLSPRFAAVPNSAMLEIANPEFVPVVTGLAGQASYSLAGYRRKDKGLITILGFDNDQRASETDRLLANAVRWTGNGGIVRWIPLQGPVQSIAPGDSFTVFIPVTARELAAGVYQGQARITSNDPVFFDIHIPVNLEVHGQAALGLSDSCMDFGQLGRYRLREEWLILSNTGCDSLFFDSLRISGNVFSTTDSLPPLLLPGESDTLVLQFEPQQVLRYNDSLWIYSSLGDSLICLIGEGLPVPQTSLETDSLGVQVSTCTDTSRFSFWLYNEGPVSTPYKVIAGRGRGSTGMLVVIDQFPWGFDIVTWLGQQFGFPLNTISSSGLDSHDLSSYGWIMFVGDQPNAYYNCVIRNEARLEQFVQSGGLLQMHLATRGVSIRLPGGLSSRDGFREGNNDILMPGHPVMQGLGSPLQGNMANHGYFSNLPPQARVLSRTSLSQLPTTVVYSLGRGEVLATTMTWEYLYNQPGLNSQPLLAKATGWLAAENGASPAWLTIRPDSGLLAANDSVQVALNIHPSGMNSGVYQTTVGVRSQDPLNPYQTVQLRMDLQGRPAMIIQDSCLLFPDTRETTRSSDTIYISNPGCDTLRVLSRLAGRAFSVQPDTVLVFAGDSAGLIIHFEPPSPGIYYDSLWLETAVGDSMICLEGKGLGTPRWRWQEDTLHLRMKVCEDSLEAFAELQSRGSADLYFRMPDDPQADSMKLLALSLGTDTMSIAWQRMRQLLQNRLPRHRWTSTSSTDMLEVDALLRESDIVLVPPLDQGGVAAWNNLGPLLQQYVTAGGGLLWCGSGYLQASPLFNSGLINGSYGGRLGAGGLLNTPDPTAVVTQGFPDTVQTAQAVYYLDAQLQPLDGIQARAKQLYRIGIPQAGQRKNHLDGCRPERTGPLARQRIYQCCALGRGLFTKNLVGDQRAGKYAHRHAAEPAHCGAE
ncbi:MAG: PKD domain-containing protein [Bacteroidia bacterium]